MEYECLREEKFGFLWPDALIQREDLIFNHFTEYYGMVHSLLFRRIPLSQLAYFQFPVISNKEKFVLALVINVIFPVIYFYDDNPLRLSQIPGNALKDASVFYFHGATVAMQRRKTTFKSMR